MADSASYMRGEGAVSQAWQLVGAARLALRGERRAVAAADTVVATLPAVAQEALVHADHLAVVGETAADDPVHCA